MKKQRNFVFRDLVIETQEVFKQGDLNEKEENEQQDLCTQNFI